MVEYFSENEITEVKTERRNTLVPAIVLAVLYVAFLTFMLVSYSGLPYNYGGGVTYKIITYAVTVVVCVYEFIYLGIKFKRVNKYYKMLLGLKNDLKSETTGYFVGYSNELETKDGVDVKRMSFSVYNKYKQEYFERITYVPFEKDFPLFEKGQKIRYITQANILISYEILQEEKEQN
ncbi:MAG: hypothetical protein MJ072_00280 [Clostridia bacterium]|nr:hypothetical protein [Clostridia bacterium]